MHLFLSSVPCCPDDLSVSLISTETLEISWTSVRGAELYETIAADGSEWIHCNDTAPVCALSDLTCDSLYSVVVRPCSETQGCNNTCSAHTRRTGTHINAHLHVNPQNTAGQYAAYKKYHDGTMFFCIVTII